MTRAVLAALVLPAALVACGSGAPRLQTRTDVSLESRLERARSARGVPGMGAAIVRGARITVAVAGRRRVDRDARSSPPTSFIWAPTRRR